MDEAKIDKHLLSFIPEEMDVYTAVMMIVDLDPDLPSEGRVKPMNTVNTHIFKPRFYNERGTLLVYAASMDIAMQTISAINKYLNIKNLPNIPFMLQETDISDTYKSLLSGFKPTGHVVVGQPLTFVEYAFFSLIYRSSGESDAWDFMHKFNAAHWLDKYNIPGPASYVEFIEAYLQKQGYSEDLIGQVEITQEVNGDFVKAVAIKFNNQEYTVIQRPWGKRLTEELGRYLQQFPEIQDIYFAGGCAGLNDDMNVDDIVLPTGYSSLEHERIVYENAALVAGDDSLKGRWQVESDFPKLHYAPVHTVHTSLSSGGLSSKLSKTGVGAMEMELATLFGIVDNKRIHVVLYTMDLPIKGIRLGDTYYNYDFLMHLSNKKYRGNMLCYYLLLQSFLKD